MEYSIEPDFSIKGKVRNLYYNHSYYQNINENLNVKEQNLIENFENKKNIEIEGYKRLVKDETVTENFEFTTKNYIEIIGDKMYLQPTMFLLD